jgi:hypothetical protein
MCITHDIFFVGFLKVWRDITNLLVVREDKCSFYLFINQKKFAIHCQIVLNESIEINADYIGKMILYRIIF